MEATMMIDGRPVLQGEKSSRSTQNIRASIFFSHLTVMAQLTSAGM